MVELSAELIQSLRSNPLKGYNKVEYALGYFKNDMPHTLHLIKQNGKTVGSWIKEGISAETATVHCEFTQLHTTEDEASDHLELLKKEKKFVRDRTTNDKVDVNKLELIKIQRAFQVVPKFDD